MLILQDALNARGYTNRPLDGIFGGGTENAVRAFQRAVSLTADGICGCNTWKKLTAASVGNGRTRTVID
ncbi:MAG: peptidoglycan-binding domain-containing protein [Ruthenibacterium lactatiformans]|uniref:peptidoglycan-binding domain-containing protein n=1 Tax=Ruthenibacterium lactatiformans TaxID=1550024 RepID=UPI003995F897